MYMRVHKISSCVCTCNKDYHIRVWVHQATRCLGCAEAGVSLIRLASAYSLVYDCLNCPLSTVSVVGPKLRYAYICNEVCNEVFWFCNAYYCTSQVLFCKSRVQ